MYLPFVLFPPSVISADVSLAQPNKANFDASHELEELLLEDNPLKAKQRKMNQDNLSAEMRQMEEQCVAGVWTHGDAAVS